MVATGKAIFGCVLTGLVTLVLGLLIGHYGIKSTRKEPNQEKTKLIEQLTAEKFSTDDDVINTILKQVDEGRIEENLKELSKESHIAGTARDEFLAEWIRRRWKEDGLDEVKRVSYEVLLSYPTEERNQVQIVNEFGQVVYRAANRETVVASDDTFAYAFNGYSPPADVTASVVYVNYGRVEDFDELESLGVNVTGKICIARYGKIYRGNKVDNAESRGAVGVIMFLDPSEVALDGTNPKDVYPNSWWMPGDAMQRGSVYIGNGDPLTPGYPSTYAAYRYRREEMKLPKIPAQPIGYDDAREILSMMAGTMAPANWSGGLDITYRVGPGFNSENVNKMIRLIVNNEFKRKVSSNVIGLIEGETEPDRYVLLGNHRDAWGYGAIDPSSGTAQLLEVTRILGSLRKKGWKPRRSLVFCSWGAEEYGLVGSTEWVEEHLHGLTSQAVGYINVDICTSGDQFHVAASPMMGDIVRNATKLVQDPISKEKTLYEVWKAYSNKSEKYNDPPVDTLGSGSDHAPFSFFGGIPAIDLTWTVDKVKYPISGYPPYHTAYETFNMVKKFIDPDFSKHKNCAQISSIIGHILANSGIIPYNLVDMARRLRKIIEAFEMNGVAEKLNALQITLVPLKEAIEKFQRQTEIWHKDLGKVNTNNPLAVRQANDRMMMLERVFIKPDGLPNRPDVRNVAFAPSQFDQYSSSGFPAVSDLLYGYKQLSDPDKKVRKQQLERHISDLIIIVDMAISFLKTHTII